MKGAGYVGSSQGLPLTVCPLAGFCINSPELDNHVKQHVRFKYCEEQKIIITGGGKSENMT